MDFNIEVRRKQLENLDQFINSSKDRVESILDYLGWTKQGISESHKEMAKCLFDANHRIPASKAAKHMQECSFRKEGYAKNEKLLSEPNPIQGSSILIDDVTKIQILNQALTKNPSMKTGWRTGEPTPRTSDRLLSVYTYDERLALYDYVVASTSGPPQVPEFNTTETKKEEKSFSLEEIKTLKRDSKRRRIKYKAKSVHSSRKNTTEIMREVINGQMEAYEDWVRHELNMETSSTTSTTQNQEPVSPISSSRQSMDDFTRNESRNRYRSQSKDSELSKYTNRSRESNRHKHNREISFDRDTNNKNRLNINETLTTERLNDRDTSYDRERSRSSHHKDRSLSRSKRYENERKYEKDRRYDKERKYEKERKYDKYERNTPKSKYDSYNRYDRREKDDRQSFKREKLNDKYNDDGCSNRKFRSHSVKEEYE